MYHKTFYFICVFILFTCFCFSGANCADTPSPLVKTYIVKRQDIAPEASFVGLTKGSLAVQLRAQVGGILKKRNFNEGQFVNKDDILFEIDPDTYIANRDHAKAKRDQVLARLDNADREWKRVSVLYSKNALSQKDRDNALSNFEAAKADLAAAEAALNEAEIQLGYAYVKAPISGFTSKEVQTEGNLISVTGESSLLTEINQNDPIFVEFSIPNTDLMQFSRLVTSGKAVWGENPEAKIRFADGSLYDNVGTVPFIDSKVDQITSVIRARASFPNTENLVLPGQFVRVDVKGPKLINVLVVPSQALLHTQKGAMLMLIDDKKSVNSRIVKVLLSMGDYSVIEEGINEGDIIVTEGVNKIRDGQIVRIANEKTENDMKESR